MLTSWSCKQIRLFQWIPAKPS